MRHGASRTLISLAAFGLCPVLVWGQEATQQDLGAELVTRPSALPKPSRRGTCVGECPRAERSGFGVAPFAGVTYSGETSVMFGAAAVLFYRPPPELRRRSSQTSIGVAYSVRNQLATSITSDTFVLGDQLLLRSQVNFLRFPDSFFGIGNDTRLEDEERFTPLVFEVRLSAQYQMLKDFFVGPTSRYQTVDILSLENGGLLDSGVFGVEGGEEIWCGLAADYDARDSTIYPTRGEYFQYFTLVSDPVFGSDFRMSLTRVDLRRYVALPIPQHVLAFQALGRFTTGRVPFYGLGRLGGKDLLRGHFNGRYRDRQLWALQGEYRMPLVWRLGVAGFGGVGDVAAEVAEFRLNTVKYSVGGGLRLNLSKKEHINARADFGWAGDDWDAYVNVGEAF